MNKHTKFNKLNLVIIAVCLVLIASLSIGYSVLSERLNVNTTVTLRAEKDIRITGLSDPNPTNSGYEEYTSRFTEDTITNNIVLPLVNSTVSYDVTITNNGTAAMQITKILKDVYSNDNIIFTMDNVKIGTIIAAGDTLTFKLTFSYDSSILSIPDNTSLGSVISFVFEEFIYNKPSYVTGNVLLNLEGVNSPLDNKWMDYDNNKELTLNNVIYNSDGKYYDFSGGGYASLGSAIIPETGDFTLEAYISTPSDISTTADQAIVSQVSDTSNDSGRFKFNLKGNTLVTFVNKQTPAGNSTFTFTNNTYSSTRYLLQIVRSGDKMYTYLNGTSVGSSYYSYATSNKISQGPFKLGIWNNGSVQSFDGKIYAVRLYSRALDTSELTNNLEVDREQYSTNLEKNNLYTLATKNQVVTSGNGLYKVSDSNYIYKGESSNNYIKFKGDTDLYRILNYNPDGTMKLLNVSFNNNVSFDASGNRNSVTSPYCVSSSINADENSFYGCNVWSASTIDGLGVINDSTAKVFLDDWYNKLDDFIKTKIIKHDFNGGIVSVNITLTDALDQSKSTVYNEYVSLISIDDVINTMVSPPTNIAASNIVRTYLRNGLDDSKAYWLLNPVSGNTYDMWTMLYGSTLGGRRASRTSQVANSGVNTLFYVQPAFYVSSNVLVSGTGTLVDPFIIFE